MKKTAVAMTVILIVLAVLSSALYFKGWISPNSHTTFPTEPIENWKPSYIDTSHLSIHEYPKIQFFTEYWPLDWKYNQLVLSGIAENTGEDTAVNVGLHITAYNANNTLLFDMILPPTEGSYGANARINRELNNPTIELSTLHGGESSYFLITIFHEDEAANWTVTPTWTNSPTVTPANLTILSSQVTEIPKTGRDDSNVSSFYSNVSSLYNCLDIRGQLTNTGERTAYNASLLVVGYTANNNLLFNVSVGFRLSSIGTTREINSLLYPDFYSNVSVPLTNSWLSHVYGGETVRIFVRIYHEDEVAKWTITPVWLDHDIFDQLGLPDTNVPSPEPTSTPYEEPQPTELDVTTGSMFAILSIVVFLGLLVYLIKRK